MLPNLFIVGPPKCASSSLHFYLEQHPEIFMSEIKETRFFDLNYEKGLSYYENTFFKGADNYKVVGESTPTYSFLPFVAERISSSIKNAKLIFSFRNPIERAYSGWFMQYGKNAEKLNFHDAILKNIEQQRTIDFEDRDFTEKWIYSQKQLFEKNNQTIKTFLEAGLYINQLTFYLRFFNKEQIHIVLVEELNMNLDLTLSNIFKFLNVDDQFIIPNKAFINTSSVRRLNFLFNLIGKKGVSTIGKIIPTGLKEKSNKILIQPKSKPEIPAQTKILLKEYFKESILDLQEFLNRDLSSWLN